MQSNFFALTEMRFSLVWSTYVSALQTEVVVLFFLNTSDPRFPVGVFKQLSTMWIEVTGTCQVRCWQSQQVHHDFQTGAGLK